MLGYFIDLPAEVAVAFLFPTGSHSCTVKYGEKKQGLGGD